MNFNQLMHAFFNAQFNYYSLVWMLHSRKLNSKIKRLHENNLSTFEGLLELDDSVSILNHRNLQCLAIGLYKIFSGISPDSMKDISPLNISSIYDIRSKQTLYTRPAKSVYRRIESLSFLVSKTWELIPVHVGSSTS